MEGPAETQHMIIRIYEENLGKAADAYVYEVIVKYWNVYVSDVNRKKIRKKRKRIFESEESSSSSCSEDDENDSDDSSGTCREEPIDLLSLSTCNADSTSSVEIPFINRSDVHYHFTNCYKEQNGTKILQEQMNMLMEMQKTVFDNGLFCKRRINNNNSSSTGGGEGTAELELLKNDFEEITEKHDKMKESFSGSIQLLLSILGQIRSGDGRRRFDDTDFYDDAVKKTKSFMSEYSALSSTRPRTPRQATQKGHDICLKLREAQIVERLGKSIVSLHNRIMALEKAKCDKPWGQSSIEFYANLNMQSEDETSVDRAVRKKRSSDILNSCGIKGCDAILAATNSPEKGLSSASEGRPPPKKKHKPTNDNQKPK
jgi:hypothetical protein